MKRVSLFVTCIVDMLFPDTGEATLDILEKLGLQVDFPQAQTCCGQPAFNSGFQEESRAVARRFLQVFKDSEAIVTPSGSCATSSSPCNVRASVVSEDSPRRESTNRFAAGKRNLLSLNNDNNPRHL